MGLKGLINVTEAELRRPSVCQVCATNPGPWRHPRNGVDVTKAGEHSYEQRRTFNSHPHSLVLRQLGVWTYSLALKWAGVQGLLFAIEITCSSIQFQCPGGRVARGGKGEAEVGTLYYTVSFWYWEANALANLPSPCFLFPALNQGNSKSKMPTDRNRLKSPLFIVLISTCN